LPHKNVIFSEFRLNHKRILPGKDSPLKTETNKVSGINLNYYQNSFSLGFECVDFVQPGRGFFHWKLENFDDDWLVSDNLSNINYTNLNPGDYTFKVKVVDERGELMSNEKTINITILNPYWLTGWAFVVYGLILLLLIGTVLYFYRLRINSKNSSERLGFLINLAHDIKTPLLLIKAPLNDLMANENISGMVRKNVNIALSSAERLHKQMIQFLDMGNLSRIENTLTLEHTDLVQFINEKITAFKVLAEKKGIALSFIYETPDLCVKMDKELLDKILSNLISNGIKYTNEGGKVVIKLQVTGGLCKILVTDSGIGILRSEQKNIFKPFYRTDRAKQSGSTGNGMGLVLACNLAKMLKGKLSLTESSEKGTTFEFKFPYELSKKEDLILEVNEEHLAQNENLTRLLLVEDDAELLSFSVSKLQEHYQVITAKNGLEAIEKCKQTLPNIIISDVLMPQMNGLQLCMKLKADIGTSHIPIILFTGLDSKEEVLEGLEAGADDYIVKPFEFDILIRKIDTLLNNRLILQKKFLLQTEGYEEVGFASKLDDEWISEVNKYVDAHMEDPELSPSVLYKKFGMSRSAFYHKTKSLVDLSPNELIRTIRLKKAKSLLGNPDNDISEVAYKLGFNDPKYFSTLFKRYFGQTPTSFIAQVKTLRESQ
jgi:signal transduction histidine kinase/AraC-like DNA-binding protein